MGKQSKAGAASRLDGLGGAGVGQLAIADEAKSAPPSLTSLGRAYHSRSHAYKQAAGGFRAPSPSSPLLCALGAWLPQASHVRAMYAWGSPAVAVPRFCPQPRTQKAHNLLYVDKI